MKNFNILFIDDSVLYNFYLANTIETAQLPINAHFASNPLNVLAYLQSLKATDFPDALVIDIDMSGMNGFELVDQFVQHFHPTFKSTALFLSSSSYNQEWIKKIKNSDSITSFFEKPFTKFTFHNSILPILLANIKQRPQTAPSVYSPIPQAAAR